MSRVPRLPLGAAPSWQTRLWGALPTTPSRIVSSVTLLLGTAVFVGSVVASYKVRADWQQAELKSQLQPLPPRPARPVRAVQAGLPVVGERELGELAATVRRLNFPWPSVLDDLERFTPSNVAVLELEPDPARGRLHLLVEARAADEVLGFVDRLNGAAALSRPRVLKYEVNTQHAARPVRFQLQADMPALRGVDDVTSGVQPAGESR